ncbi:MAG: energy transducer TonB [Candidatus Marisimplicoccus sp.]|jgi:protein TonB|nr:energy transducer TonB [Cryomorphaceae bacterium]MBT7739475.1 energy transducer TonB [Cryomorphaceae bacterium]MDG1246719.1 energy transducer TonB [Flavobacteriaceae bacterium]RZP00424.1 MAG: energy transducer TonB [Flavobacteriales bacterium]|tara:strand:+ start:3006 stop:3710 length:705 start_codon:yes stop_codon:yes gene_type:complete
MQLKKNPEADLNKNRNLYFVIGLTLVLGVTWGAVEYKSYERKIDLTNGDMLVDDEEDVPITEQLKTPPPPPPPPPPAPEVIEIVEDEEEVEETVIESTESDEEMVIEDIVVEDDFDDIDVPFAVIEDVPIFPGCESVAKSQRRACFQEQMNKHIRKNFRYPDIAQEMGIQGRVYVNFIISKDGTITNIRMRGPDKNLENEAARIIGRLPQMTPGRQRGRPVRVPFSIPITFRLQ